MKIEKITILRNLIPIPMTVSVKLLRKNNDDILACEQEFHAENINHINIITDCGIKTARESYNHCNYDIKKAVEKINSRQLIITTRKNAVRKNEIGFVLWPESKEGENYKSEMRNDVFIPTDDFDYIIDEFKSVFPLEDPWDKNIEESFDACGRNYFDSRTCVAIVEKIINNKSSEEKVSKFQEEVANWFIEKLKYADYIVVYGNL